MAVGPGVVLLVLVLVVAEELLGAEPLAPALVLREIEPVDGLGARGVPAQGLVAEERLAAPQVGAAEVRIGRAVEEDLVHVDLQLADVAVHAGGTHGLVFQALGILAHEGGLRRERVLRRVDDHLVELDRVGVDVVPRLAVAGQVDPRPVVDRPVVDRPGDGIVKRLLRGGVRLGRSHREEADPRG